MRGDRCNRARHRPGLLNDGSLRDLSGSGFVETPASSAAYPQALLARVNRDDDRPIGTDDPDVVDSVHRHGERQPGATPSLEADMHSGYAKMSSRTPIATSNNVSSGRLTSLDGVAFVPTSDAVDSQTSHGLNRSVSDRVVIVFRRIADPVVRAVSGFWAKGKTVDAIGPPPQGGGRDDDVGQGR